MRILFLSRWFPYPPDNGARIRIFNILLRLAKQHHVDLISFTEGPVANDAIAEMEKICRVVKTTQYRGFSPRSPIAILGFFSLKPRSVICTFNEQLQAMVEKQAQEGYDLVIASEIDMAPYVQKLSGTKKLLEELEISKTFDEFKNANQLRRKIRTGLTWLKLSSYIRYLMKSFDGITTVSAQEYELIQGITSGKIPVGVIPNGVDFNQYQTTSAAEMEEFSLVYSGSITYQANFEAVDYFLTDILPRITAKIPAVKFYVTGKYERVSSDRLHNRNSAIFTGYLEDIRPFLARCRAVVVPLISGGGTRLKVLEALAIGTPVVSTSKGAEGLELIPGSDILIADTPEGFAQEVISLLTNQSLRLGLIQNGKKTVQSKYDWDIIAQQLLSFIDKVVQ